MLDRIGGAPPREWLRPPESGTVMVRVALDNSDGRLLPGMFARLRAATGQAREVVRVPATALVARDGRAARVFALHGTRVELRDVLLGDETDGWVVITRGLAATEALVDRPSPLLRDGAQVVAELGE